MLKPGMLVSGRYEIIDKVGSGGMADVYKAKDQRLNRYVAIKVLKPEYSSDKNFVNKFRGEAQSAAGLSHPNIVNVYDVGDDSGLHFIVMELVEGITLKRFIERKNKLEVKEAVGIAIQIAQGMEAAHDNHIIHRDIKPQNIIISRDGKVKVTDFGIAKATNSNTITSNAMGSVHYLSPEQARGGYSDEKSDIYSLGVTLYEMLSGKVPFAGDNTVSVALLHIQGEAMPLRELDPQIPISVDKIVQKCMQKRPERRYHSASELISDLKRSITNPDGDFVQIPAYTASDSPTINISDDLGKIKTGAAYLDDDLRPTKNLQPHRSDEEEDEELDSVDSKLEKVFLVGRIVAVVVLAIVIIVMVVLFLLPGKKGEEDPIGEPTPTVAITPTPEVTVEPTINPQAEMYKVPNVEGQTKEDAVAMIKAQDPDAFIEWSGEDYSTLYPAGYVYDQYPDGGSDRSKGSTVILYESLGPKPVEIYDVGGLTEAQATNKLTADGFKVVPKYDYSDTIANGLVIETSPKRGEIINAGETVEVYVSRGPENTQVAVPDLRNKTLAEAKTELTALGLEVGTVVEASSTNVAEGKIIDQSYTVGLSVDRGTTINVTVSTGYEEVTDPTTPTTYMGAVFIDANPLINFEEGEAVEIIVEMQQPGKEAENIFEGYLSTEDFPRSFEGTSDSPDTAIVRMYVEGDLYEASWTLEFTALEE